MEGLFFFFFPSFFSVPESNYTARVIILKLQGRNLINKGPLTNNFPDSASHLQSVEMYLGFPEPCQVSPDVAQKKSQSTEEVKKIHAALAVAELRSHL